MTDVSIQIHCLPCWPPFFIQQKAQSVKDALEILVGRDQLEGVTCSRTNQEIEAWQQVTLEDLPLVLLLHLKWFDYKLDGASKIVKCVEFPIDLKVDPSKYSIVADKGIYSEFGRSPCTYKRCWKWCPRAIVSINWIEQLNTLPVLHFNRCLTTEYSETTAHFNGNFDTDDQIYVPQPKCTVTFWTQCTRLQYDWATLGFFRDLQVWSTCAAFTVTCHR
jgi:hypothetical protein